MYFQIFTVLFPVILCAFLGALWASSGQRYDSDFVSRLVLNIGAPALILSTLSQVDIDPSLFSDIAIAFVLLYVFLALFCFVFLFPFPANLALLFSFCFCFSNFLVICKRLLEFSDSLSSDSCASFAFCAFCSVCAFSFSFFVFSLVNSFFFFFFFVCVCFFF